MTQTEQNITPAIGGKDIYYCIPLSKLSQMAEQYIIDDNLKVIQNGSNKVKDLKFTLNECIHILSNYKDQCKLLKNQFNDLNNLNDNILLDKKILTILESAYIYYKIIHTILLKKIPNLKEFKDIKNIDSNNVGDINNSINNNDKNINNNNNNNTNKTNSELLEIYNGLVKTLFNDENILNIKTLIKEHTREYKEKHAKQIKYEFNKDLNETIDNTNNDDNLKYRSDLPQSGFSIDPKFILDDLIPNYGSQSILFIDIRPRLEFNLNHIDMENVICLEPISIKENYSDFDILKKSLITSPTDEINLFEKRNKFKFIIIYTNLNKLTQDNEFLLEKQYLILNILLNKSFDKPIDINLTKIFILDGGFSNWIESNGKFKRTESFKFDQKKLNSRDKNDILTKNKLLSNPDNNNKNLLETGNKTNTDNDIYINGDTSRLNLKDLPILTPSISHSMDKSMKDMMSHPTNIDNKQESYRIMSAQQNSDLPKRTSSLKKLSGLIPNFINNSDSSLLPSSLSRPSTSSTNNIFFNNNNNNNMEININSNRSNKNDTNYSYKTKRNDTIQSTYPDSSIKNIFKYNKDNLKNNSSIDNSNNDMNNNIDIDRNTFANYPATPFLKQNLTGENTGLTHPQTSTPQLPKLPRKVVPSSTVMTSTSSPIMYSPNRIRSPITNLTNKFTNKSYPIINSSNSSNFNNNGSYTGISNNARNTGTSNTNNNDKIIMSPNGLRQSETLINKFNLDFIIGLENMGNSCYLNCIIQCLLGTHELTKIFLNNSFEKHINIASKLGSKGVLARNFAKLINTMHNHDIKQFDNNKSKKIDPVRPQEFKKACGSVNSLFNDNLQQDSQEFCQFLLDGLHEDLNQNGGNPPLKELSKEAEEKRETLPIRIASSIEWERFLTTDFSVIVDLFQGQYASRLQCKVCNRTSTTYQPFSVLSIPLPPKIKGKECNIIDCFNEFTKVENLEIDEQWHCPDCKKKQPSTKTLMITRLPKNLVIHLKRFDNQLNKNNSMINYPFQLDLTEFWVNDLDKFDNGNGSELPTRGQIPPFNYKLYGVACHFGSLYGGHYTSYVDKGLGKGWYYFDDTNCRRVKNINEPITSNAYVLFYKRIYGGIM